MDIDTPVVAGSSTMVQDVVSTETEPRSTSFDLEAIIANYEGRTKINRLLFITRGPIQYKGPALTLALEAIKSSTLDVALYESTFSQYSSFYSDCAAGSINDSEAMRWYDGVRGRQLMMDHKWCEKTNKETRMGVDRLEVELKGYTTNLIKESIRMGHRDLAVFLKRKGDLAGAISSYTKSREFCTTSQQVLEMCLGVIGVALETNNYSFARNYVVKAESALEALNSAAQSGQSKSAASNIMPGMVAPSANAADTAKDIERKVTSERLTVAAGVAYLGSGNYEKAARAFTGVGRETLLGSIPHFIPPADIALYAVLTGLAVFNRVELRTRLLENADLRAMIDLEPYLRDVIRAFHASQFKEGLLLLEQHAVRQYLDIHLSQHVNVLMESIRSRALLSYFAPFATVSLDKMSSAFGIESNHLVPQVVQLIQRGTMEARIDGQAGVLVAKKKDVRIEAFKNALKEGKEIERKTKGMAFRMKLVEADILVKAPKVVNSNQ